MNLICEIKTNFNCFVIFSKYNPYPHQNHAVKKNASGI